MNEESSDKASLTEGMFCAMNTSILVNDAASGQAASTVSDISPVAATAALIAKANPVQNLKASPALLASIVALSAMSGAIAYLTAEKVHGHSAIPLVSHGSLPSPSLSPNEYKDWNTEATWLSASLIHMFRMDFVNFRSQAFSVLDTFTEQGFQEFNQLISQDGTLKAMIDEKQVMTLTLQDSPQVWMSQWKRYLDQASLLDRIGLGQREIFTEFKVPVLRQFTSNVNSTTKEDVFMVRVVPNEAYDGHGHQWLISSIRVIR